MTERRCAHCRRPLPSTSRGDRKFCSPSCRTMGYKARRRRRAALADAVAVQQPAHEPVASSSASAPSAAELANQRLAVALEQMLAEPRLVAEIVKASTRGNWRASAYLLERVYPERWAATRQRRPDEEPYAQPDPFAEFVTDELAARRKPRN